MKGSVVYSEKKRIGGRVGGGRLEHSGTGQMRSKPRCKCCRTAVELSTQSSCEVWNGTGWNPHSRPGRCKAKLGFLMVQNLLCVLDVRLTDGEFRCLCSFYRRRQQAKTWRGALFEQHRVCVCVLILLARLHICSVRVVAVGTVLSYLPINLDKIKSS